MGLEIERKYLVKGDSWRGSVESEERIVQGYIAANANASVRVRIKGEQAFLTVKGGGPGLARSEYEYPIPVADAERMLRTLSVTPPIDKVRSRVRNGRHVWELDRFSGANTGLVLAELELTAVDEPFEIPDWAGEEVTADHRYYNVNLARCPYAQWPGRSTVAEPDL